MKETEFRDCFANITGFKRNRFHPLVWIVGEPQIGENVYIGGMSEVNANGAKVIIGDNCDIASFVTINCADSHKKAIGLLDEIERRDITIEESVFIGSHCVIKGGAHIGHHSVISAGTIVEGTEIPPYSLVIGNPMKVKAGYYKRGHTEIPHNKPALGHHEEQAAAAVIRSGWVAQGGEVEALENELCEYLGLPPGHAVAVSSGTAALYLSLWALNAVDKKVAFPVYACSALRHAVSLAGGEEILLDIEPGYPNIGRDAILASLDDICIVPHMFGLPVDLSSVADRKNIIEDCAQSLGAVVNDIPVGLQGRVGIFSFYATKLITSGGQGGMVVAKDKGIADKVRDFRQFDQRADQKQRFNFQMTDLQAAVGRSQLRSLPIFLRRRAEIFNRYIEAGIKLIDLPEPSAGRSSAVRYRAVLRASEPRKLIGRLAADKIKAIIPIEDWELLGSGASYPNAWQLSNTTVSLPIYPSLSDSELERIIAGVLKA